MSYHSFCSVMNDSKIRSEENRLFSNNADWRIISSGVVTRPMLSCNTPEECTRINKIKAEEEDNSLDVEFYLSSHWTETLRKPTKFSKSKKLLEDDSHSSGMTKNCEKIFSQMKSSFNVTKSDNQIDPSASVRRIVKNSGLLQAFGTGVLDHIQTDHSVWENDNASCSGTSQASSITPKEKMVFDVNEFMGSSVDEIKGYNQDLWDSESLVESDSPEIESSPVSSPRPIRQCWNFSNTVGPVMFDTFLMQKTIETEVVEYMPMDETKIQSSPNYPATKMRSGPYSDTCRPERNLKSRLVMNPKLDFLGGDQPFGSEYQGLQLFE